MSEWISVKERLPESNKKVWALDGGYHFEGYYTIGHEIEFDDEDYEGEYDPIEEERGVLYLKPGWYDLQEQRNSEYDECWFKRDVTHWIPLPEPPQP